ncbi:hypothetical protein MKW92_048264, partial [Papaver armeniacum]
NDLRMIERLSFSEHLSLGNNEESDFEAFKATLMSKSRICKFINSQGFVMNWDLDKQTGTWSSVGLDSPFWSLPGILPELILAKLRSLDKENSVLKSYINSSESRSLGKESSVLKLL